MVNKSIYESTSHADYCQAGDGRQLCDIPEETLMPRHHDKNIPVSWMRDFPSVCRFICNVAGMLTSMM